MGYNLRDEIEDYSSVENAVNYMKNYTDCTFQNLQGMLDNLIDHKDTKLSELIDQLKMHGETFDIALSIGNKLQHCKEVLNDIENDLNSNFQELTDELGNHNHYSENSFKDDISFKDNNVSTFADNNIL